MDALVTEPARQGLSKATRSQIKRREQALALHRNGHTDHAIEFYKAYLKRHPQDSAVWSNLGACLRRQNKLQSARACYQRALSIEPDNIAAKGNLGNVLKDLHRMDQAIILHREVVAEDSLNVQPLINLAAALRENKCFDEALVALDKAHAMQNGHAGTRWERGQNLLHLGRYREGFEAYEARWHTGDLPVPVFQCPRWNGEPLKGKRLLLHAEQGFGDTILAARYLPLLLEQGAQVTWQIKPELHRLFAGIGADRIVAPGEHFGRVDYHCPMMSLMAILGTEVETIPAPIQVLLQDTAQEKFAYLADTVADHFKVGIVWSGSVTFKNNAGRSVPLDRFAPLAELPGVRLFSFQKGPRLKELYDQGADAYIENIGSHCDDFADTAAALEHMDLVVMTDSSLAHLAGSLGKPVINLLQYVPYWIYSLEDEVTPWYPSHRLVKQKRPGDWDSVFEQATCLLQELVARKKDNRWIEQ